MGEAYDRTGAFLSETRGATKEEVLKTLVDRHGDDAEEIRIRTVRDDQPRTAPLSQREKLDEVFKYHAPTPDDTVAYEKLRSAAKDFARAILDLTPPCADQSAAIRLVREAVMTANASIALHGLV